MVNYKRNILWFGFLIVIELVVLLLYISPVLIYGSIGFPLDDSWIYAVFARNFISSGEIAFNLGHTSLGFTSSLWFLFLSLGRFFGFSPVGWGIFLGCIAQITLAAVTGLLVYRFLITGGGRSERSLGVVSNRANCGTPPTLMSGDPGEANCGTPTFLMLGDSGAGQSGSQNYHTGLVQILSFFASLLVLLCGPLIWYSLSGMETTCFMAIGMLAIYLLSRGWYCWAGLALGFLLFTRIEGIALWGIALLYSVIVERRTVGAASPGSGNMTDSRDPGERPVGEVSRSEAEIPRDSRDNLDPGGTRQSGLSVILPDLRKPPPPGGRICGISLFPFKKLLPLIILPSIFLLLELIKNLCLTGALLPTTFAGRKWLSVPAGGRGPIAYLKLWGFGFKLTLLPQFLQENPLLIIFWVGAGILTVLSIRLAWKEARANKQRISGLSLLILWAIGHNLVYMVMLPSPSQAGRYQALNFLLFWIVLYLPIAGGLSRLAGGVNGRKKMLSGLALSVILCAILLLDLGSTLKWKEIYLATVRHINDVHIKVAGRIKNELPPASRVAAFDIGALKYFSPGTEIIDLGGLVDREFSGYLREGKVVDYMKDRQVSYLAMMELQNSPGWIFENLKIKGDPRLKLHPLFGMMQRPEIYRIHYQTAAITFPKMVVYEIEWGMGNGEWGVGSGQ